MKIESKYDIIIAGGGLSGLSLAWYLAAGNYKGQVLIVDSTFAPINDKTWCFWTNEEPPFKNIIYKNWKKAYVSVEEYKAFQYMNKYSYHCIRSGDFREYILSKLKDYSNIDFLEEDILDLSSNKNKAILTTKSGDSYLANYIFQSILQPDLDKSKIRYPLMQHFLGMEIEAHEPAFDSETFTIMDFDDDYGNGIAFMYVLPWNQHKALFEYTIFSDKTEKKKFYKKKIRNYLYHKFGLDKEHYTIGRKELGKIPMEDRPYSPWYQSNIMNIGSVGGFTKPSTGYTFTRIQKYTRALANSLIENKKPALPLRSEFRFRYYDLLLLHILSTSPQKSISVFKQLYKNNHIDDIFRFLGEDTHFAQDLKIMSSVPSSPFFKAIWGTRRQLLEKSF